MRSFVQMTACLAVGVAVGFGLATARSRSTVSTAPVTALQQPPSQPPQEALAQIVAASNDDRADAEGSIISADAELPKSRADRAKAMQLLSEAQTLLESGRFDEARAKARQAMTYDGAQEFLFPSAEQAFKFAEDPAPQPQGAHERIGELVGEATGEASTARSARTPNAERNQELANRVAKALRMNNFHGYDLDIDVRNGEVTLDGTSPDKTQRDAVSRCVADVEGVLLIRNRIMVRDSDSTEPVELIGAIPGNTTLQLGSLYAPDAEELASQTLLAKSALKVIRTALSPPNPITGAGIPDSVWESGVDFAIEAISIAMILYSDDDLEVLPPPEQDGNVDIAPAPQAIPAPAPQSVITLPAPPTPAKSAVK